MATSDKDFLLETGRQALAAGDWASAKRIFETALVEEDGPKARPGLGNALWWLGDFRASLDHRERAYAQLRRRHQRTPAAMVAIWLAIAYKAGYGNLSAARGWTCRAERLLEGVDGPPRGWLLLAQAGHTADPARGERLARRAVQAGQRFGDTDLELCALSQVGAYEVVSGRVEDGVRRLEEATAAALGGESNDLTTVVFTACLMLIACKQCGDVERAVSWCRAADRFVDRYGAPYLFAWCRTVYAAVLVALGQWGEAEGELKRAIATSENIYRRVHAEALAALGGLRVSQGRLEDAASLLSRIDADPAAAIAVARLRLARGQAEVAACALRRRLAHLADDVVQAVPLLELLVEADVVAGEALEAQELVERLSALATLSGRGIDVARAEISLGRVAAALGDAAKAQHHLQAAMEAFVRAEMPFEGACARLELARMLAQDSTEAAVAEAHGALVAFERLGARRHADAAAALSRSLGGRPRTGPRSSPNLTRRQAEVLDLVAQGLSNPQIANRLYLSRRTVEHHVESVLAKLGLRCRAEAVAYALTSGRNGGTHPCSPGLHRPSSPAATANGDDDRHLDT